MNAEMSFSLVSVLDSVIMIYYKDEGMHGLWQMHLGISFELFKVIL